MGRTESDDQNNTERETRETHHPKNGLGTEPALPVSVKSGYFWLPENEDLYQEAVSLWAHEHLYYIRAFFSLSSLGHTNPTTQHRLFSVSKGGP